MRWKGERRWEALAAGIASKDLFRLCCCWRPRPAPARFEWQGRIWRPGSSRVRARAGGTGTVRRRRPQQGGRSSAPAAVAQLLAAACRLAGNSRPRCRRSRAPGPARPSPHTTCSACPLPWTAGQGGRGGAGAKHGAGREQGRLTVHRRGRPHSRQQGRHGWQVLPRLRIVPGLRSNSSCKLGAWQTAPGCSWQDSRGAASLTMELKLRVRPNRSLKASSITACK